MNMTSVQQEQHFPVCKRCKGQMDLRVKRNPLIKLFLFWLPLKKYFCTHCLRGAYVLDAKGTYSNNII